MSKKVFLALWVFTILMGLMLALICSCAERVVAPNEQGIAEITVAGVKIEFNFKNSTITIENTTAEWVTIEIGRWNSDVNDFLTIYRRRIYGYGRMKGYAAFRHGDYIRIKIWIGGTEIPPECFTLG